MKIASANPKFLSSMFMLRRISQAVAARQTVNTIMANPTATHTCQLKGSKIAFHCISTESGVLMITCVLLDRKLTALCDAQETNESVKLTRYQVWL
jgi:hypothetical protein